MSDWFKNSASEIPDDLWRAPTPMQRQADAVVMWAELTGKHASAGQEEDLSFAEKAYLKAYPLGTKNSRSEALRTHRALRRKAELTGAHKKTASLAEMVGYKEAAWKPGVQKAIRMAGDNLELTGAAIGAPVGGLKAYTENRKGRGGISNAEATVLGEIAKARAQKADKKQISQLRQKLQTVKSRRENIGATTAKGVGIGTVTGALGAHALKRSRKARRK